LPSPTLAATTRMAAIVMALLTGGADMPEAADRPLADLRWQNRVIVIMAATGDDPALLDQETRLRAAATDLAERDVVLITATGDTVTIDGNTSNASAAHLRQAYAAGTSGFQVLLIGKDGGVKLRSSEPVAAGDFCALIDAMPMRRREMRERS
jgi:hypothetical protein